jgi:hypothetical protein
VLRIVTALAVAWSVAHFARSGVYQAFDHPNLGKFHEEASPLQEHLATGAPVHSRNPAQYGPAFFFVMHPLLRLQPDDETLARWLYAIQIACLVASFALTCAVLTSIAFDIDRSRWRFVVVWLAIVWLNFSPLYTVIALKSVETWELFLIALALYAQLRGWRWTSAIAIAAAGLIKVLPFAFVYYWLVTDRRRFAYACIATGALLAIGHVLYGPEMGFWYLPRIVGAASGSSYGLDWHENFSLKAAIAKLFGDLPQPTLDAARTSGYFVAWSPGRKTAAILVGDAAVLACVAGLTSVWLRWRGARSRERTVWEWSLLTVAILILSPNTIFEYLTIALGATSYAFVRLVERGRRDAIGWSAFIVSLVLMGGLLPRQLMNRLALVAMWQRWTGVTHLTESEAYQYYALPLVGLVLLAIAIGRLVPSTRAIDRDRPIEQPIVS